jgi:hypothetical protein
LRSAIPSPRRREERIRIPTLVTALVALVLVAAAVPTMILAWRSALGHTADASGVVGGALGVAGLALVAAGTLPVIAGRTPSDRTTGWRASLTRPELLIAVLGVGVLLCAGVAAG